MNTDRIGIFFTILILPKVLHIFGVIGMFSVIFIAFVIKKMLWIMSDDKHLEEKFGIRKTKPHSNTK